MLHGAFFVVVLLAVCFLVGVFGIPLFQRIRARKASTADNPRMSGMSEDRRRRLFPTQAELDRALANLNRTVSNVPAPPTYRVTQTIASDSTAAHMSHRFANTAVGIYNVDFEEFLRLRELVRTGLEEHSRNEADEHLQNIVRLRLQEEIQTLWGSRRSANSAKQPKPEPPPQVVPLDLDSKRNIKLR